MNEITASVHYAAYSYLDEWVYKDSRFYNILAVDRASLPANGNGAKVLAEMAGYYGVARTLMTTGETPRLDAAYKALQAIERPTEHDVADKVTAFAHQLGATYGSVSLSAASKFMWARFRSPVVIYDSIVSKWLHDQKCGYKYESYRTYCDAWRGKYLDIEDDIDEACSELRTTAIKKFTLACNVPDREFQEWTNSRWFRERVFDHFVLAQSNTADENVKRRYLY